MAESDAEIVQLITDQLLLLPQDEKYKELKLSIRRGNKAEKSGNLQEAITEFSTTEDQLDLLMVSGTITNNNLYVASCQ